MIVDPADLQARIVAELNIGHLDAAEQDKVINAVSEVLVKRATFAVMQQIPEDVQNELDTLAEAGDTEKLNELVRKHVPNVTEVVAQAAREGLEEHKRLVTELAAKQ